VDDYLSRFEAAPAPLRFDLGLADPKFSFVKGDYLDRARKPTIFSRGMMITETVHVEIPAEILQFAERFSAGGKIIGSGLQRPRRPCAWYGEARGN
jgi:hypothetical protein